jgi:hypothetical protein
MLIIINECELECFEDGRILRLMKSNTWKEIPNRANHIKGYNVIMINKKQYMRSQIIALAFLEYDLNKKVMIGYLDQNKLNCNKDNLDIKYYERKEIKPSLVRGPSYSLTNCPFSNI